MVDGSVFLRRELMIRFVRAFNNGSLETELDRFPVLMRPRQGGSSRCCIYRDRAVIKYRLMNLLGFSCEEEVDEARSLASFALTSFTIFSLNFLASSFSQSDMTQEPLRFPFV